MKRLTETKQAAYLIPSKPERRLPALAVSRGIGIGRISFFHGERRRFFKLNLNPEQVEAEFDRFKIALDKAILQLRELSTSEAKNGGQPISGIFGFHLLMLESPLAGKIKNVIATQRVNAEWAIRTVLDEYVEKQGSISDLQFRDKYLDLEDVANRLLSALNTERVTEEADFNLVVVARDLTPSQIVELAKRKPAALITEHGGWTSHSSIIAREFKLPMVSGVRDIEHLATAGDCIIVDGIKGEVILYPNNHRIAAFQALAASDTNSTTSVCPASYEVTTSDGTQVIIRANADQPAAYASARDNGATGIGLFRSESMLVTPGTIPSEDEQFAAYRNIADAAGEHGVNIRTFDFGSHQLGNRSGRIERNPSLGLRAIRLSLVEPAHFRAQIRALLRASFERKLGIILPMISGVGELAKAKEIIKEESINLNQANIDIGSPKIGAMIETPSAVFTADEIAKNADFLCLGTNDLVQYLLAVDRDNEAVAEWYQTLHPAVIRAIREVILAAQTADIPVIVCGEMAGSPFYVPVLLGLGARELSMNFNSIQTVRRLLFGISINDTVSLVEKIKTYTIAGDIENCLNDHYLKNWSDLFPPGLLNVRHR